MILKLQLSLSNDSTVAGKKPLQPTATSQTRSQAATADVSCGGLHSLMPAWTRKLYKHTQGSHILHCCHTFFTACTPCSVMVGCHDLTIERLGHLTPS